MNRSRSGGRPVNVKVGTYVIVSSVGHAAPPALAMAGDQVI